MSDYPTAFAGFIFRSLRGDTMKEKVKRLIERFRYLQSCVSEPDVMVWESVQLSEEQIENAFNVNKQIT